MRRRPFRAPHHSISEAGLIGGGTMPRPGEVYLAHNGVLFLEEAGEFGRATLDGLRQPLEDGHVTVTRASGSLKFPARFMLVAAMNLCPCGYYGDRTRDCVCSDAQVRRYRGRLSGPLLDRLDLQIEVPAVPIRALGDDAPATDSSATIRTRVMAARAHQAERYRRDGIYTNAQLKPRHLKQYGAYLQELLSPLCPLVMPAVRDLWSYGETGFHSLAAAVVHERYAREALSAGFRILGEGQLALTKFLMLTDKHQDLREFPTVLESVLERVDWASDFFIFDRTSFDTLDYASGKINHGSKAILVGVGNPRRDLVREFRGSLPRGVRSAHVFCGGWLALEAENYEKDKELCERVARDDAFREFQMIVVLDDIELAKSAERFLWATWTRFNPSTDISARRIDVKNNHLVYEAPIVIDSRMKPWYPKEVEVRDDIARLVDQRWSEYFPSK